MSQTTHSKKSHNPPSPPTHNPPNPTPQSTSCPLIQPSTASNNPALNPPPRKSNTASNSPTNPNRTTLSPKPIIKITRWPPTRRTMTRSRWPRRILIYRRIKSLRPISILIPGRPPGIRLRSLRIRWFWSRMIRSSWRLRGQRWSIRRTGLEWYFLLKTKLTKLLLCLLDTSMTPATSSSKSTKESKVLPLTAKQEKT